MAISSAILNFNFLLLLLHEKLTIKNTHHLQSPLLSSSPRLYSPISRLSPPPPTAAAQQTALTSFVVKCRRRGRGVLIAPRHSHFVPVARRFLLHSNFLINARPFKMIPWPLFIYLLLFPFDCCGACNSQQQRIYNIPLHNFVILLLSTVSSSIPYHCEQGRGKGG